MDIKLRTNCDPESNGRTPQRGDERWTIHMPLDNGDVVYIQMGRKGRDLLFGMLIAEIHDSGEQEPT